MGSSQKTEKKIEIKTLEKKLKKKIEIFGMKNKSK